MSEEKIRRIEDELRKKTMILEELETFVVEYSFQTEELYRSEERRVGKECG